MMKRHCILDLGRCCALIDQRFEVFIKSTPPNQKLKELNIGKKTIVIPDLIQNLE
jgi:hypothetical protein